MQSCFCGAHTLNDGQRPAGDRPGATGKERKGSGASATETREPWRGKTRHRALPYVTNWYGSCIHRRTSWKFWFCTMLQQGAIASGPLVAEAIFKSSQVTSLQRLALSRCWISRCVAGHGLPNAPAPPENKIRQTGDFDEPRISDRKSHADEDFSYDSLLGLLR